MLFADTLRRRFLVAGGFLVWLGLGAHHLLEVWLEPALLASPAREACTLAFLLFGLTYAGACFLPMGQRGREALLAAQTLLGLWLSWYSFGAFTAVYVITTAQAGFLLPRRASLLWVLVQIVGAGTVLLLRPDLHLVAALTAAVMYATFELFTLFAAHAILDEALARAELSRVNAQLVEAQAALAERAREQERLQISGELHDSVGHHLTVLALKLEVASHSPPEASVTHVREARVLVGEVLAEMRTVVAEMRGQSAPGLPVRLRALAERITSPRVHLSLPESLAVEDPELAHTLFRCAQEVITNAARHAGADNLWLALRQDATHVYLEARDDGRGAPELVPNSGLRVMRERVEAAGGELRLASQPAAGVSVSIRLPLRAG